MRSPWPPALVASLALGACSDKPASTVVAPSSINDPSPAVARITAIRPEPKGNTIYVVEAGDTDGSCSFELALTRRSTAKNGPFSPSEVTMRAVRTPACRHFLESLGRAMLYSGELPASVAADALHAEAVVLGERQSRHPDGGFSSPPEGPWTNVKVFFEGDDAEFFLNISEPDRRVEFALKDEEFASAVVRNFAGLLATRG